MPPGAPTVGAKRKRPGPGAPRLTPAVFSNPDATPEEWLKSAINATVSHLVGEQFEKAKALYIEAVCDTTAHVPMGRFMAYLSCRDYRFGHDNTAKDPKKFFHFNGALHKFQPVGDVNLKTTSRDRALQVTEKFIETVKRDLPEEANDQEQEEEEDSTDSGDTTDKKKKQQLSSVLAGLLLLRKKLQNTQYLNSARLHMIEVMNSDKFYSDIGKPIPSEFCSQLDSNPMLLGFNNGVLNMRDHNGAFKFYSSGSVPPNYLVSMSVGYDYCGNDDGTAKDNQKAGMEKFEKDIINKVFFQTQMRKCAKMLLGSSLFGGNIVKKLVLLLGECGNGGKSVLLTLMELIFGDYAGKLSKNLIIEQKHTRDPDAPSAAWVSSYKKRLLFVMEVKETDVLDRTEITIKTGADSFPMRGMWGNTFNAALQAMIWLISNYAPAHDGLDTALGDRMFPLSCDAKFSKTIPKDIPEEGKFKAEDQNTVITRWKAERPAMMQLFLEYSREFAAGEKVPNDENTWLREPCTLPPPPESKAKMMVDRSATGSDFKSFVENHCESTLNNVTKKIDWPKWKEQGAMDLDKLLCKFTEITGGKIEKKEAIRVMESHGYTKSKKISNEFKVNTGLNGFAIRIIEQADLEEATGDP